jgi:formylglycine-generating enzyme required for sulfatase activity
MPDLAWTPPRSASLVVHISSIFGLIIAAALVVDEAMNPEADICCDTLDSGDPNHGRFHSRFANPSRCEPLTNDDWRDGEDLSQHPVQGVNWFQALQFCNRLSQQDGRTPCYTIKDIKMYPPPDSRSHPPDQVPWIHSAHVSFDKHADGYRLPTDSEWEYACRAGTTTTYTFGNRLTNKLANFDEVIDHTVKIGSYPPNILGIHDMHGNVAEWCHDVNQRIELLPRKDPMPLPPQVYDSDSRVNLRGGSFTSKPHVCRSANRDASAPYWTGVAKA